VLDLGHQLLLAVRDDALALDGVSSVRRMLRCSQPVPALGQLVFQSRAGLESRPRRVQKQSKPHESECLVAGGMIELVSRLRLSRQRAIAELIRGVLLRAAASSPAALGSALRRYRRLLLHARDAVDSGKVLDRNELKRFTRELDDQLIWWELLPLTEGESELELNDLPRLEQIIHQMDAATQTVDGKLGRLRNLLSDGTPTLVFVGSRDTVRYIRDRLPDLRLAWCTGDKAGFGGTTLSRQTVLGWFRESPHSPMAPVHLVVTDVAAEGLDLQRAARVVHYDLPWTPMRMEQREGRAVRYGSDHSQVEVIRFPLPRVLERQLRVHSSLARKHKLPSAVGLGSSGRQVWQWRSEVAAKLGGVSPAHGVAGIRSQTEGLLAGIALYRPGDPRPLSATVLWLEPGGYWTEAPEIIAAKLEAAATQTETLLVDRSRLNEWVSAVAKPIRERLAFTRGRRWVVPELSPGTRQALTRLQDLVREAARKHDARQLAELERIIAFVAGGHTAGEAELVNRLAQARDPEFRDMVRDLPTRSIEEENIEFQMTGLIVWGPAKVVGDGLLSSECPASRPPCSISTAP
jgi:hypothetical protein